MKIKIRYRLQGTLFRKHDSDELIRIDEWFDDDSPIEAREAAFRKYQSYVDVLLQKHDKVYQSHAQAQKDLQVFFTSSHPDANERQIVGGYEPHRKRLLISMVRDYEEPLKAGNTGNVSWVHMIHNDAYDFSEDLMTGLMEEYSYYHELNLDMKSYMRAAYMGNYQFRILQTPMFGVLEKQPRTALKFNF